MLLELCRKEFPATRRTVLTVNDPAGEEEQVQQRVLLCWDRNYNSVTHSTPDSLQRNTLIKWEDRDSVEFSAFTINSDLIYWGKWKMTQRKWRWNIRYKKILNIKSFLLHISELNSEKSVYFCWNIIKLFMFQTRQSSGTLIGFIKQWCFLGIDNKTLWSNLGENEFCE